ncbi:MAG: Phosphoesterase RecJ domain protein [Candidatus Beckwithbacteria bacterium GW2011_GWC2_47_9]|uniref:Phosphoesterase RecJ domain protein n=1 Tax=Candidatus Beckwithbacteria bacterium GW2011_GWC2_47_9 TaxID=1618373 RepID=A0A0G1TZ76_9BACT|nr:MAG: Phosphoesterase RecJ domain protein [Candidatus Beckwithbacteria bacterium GW2011_GWC2_47_9]
MAKTYNIEPVKQALITAKQVLVLLPQNPNVDNVAAALALYLALVKKGLSTTIGCSSQMTVQFNRLFGVDKIKPRIGNQNLVISFSYPEDSLEKVAYDKDPANQKFHLTIEPKAGMQPLDASQVEYSYTGSNADVIFVIGSRTLEDLGELYQQEKALLDNKSKTLVNLSTLDKNSQFGTVNLYDPTASGCSEIMATVIKALELALEPDMATNLLAGIEAATQNLTQAGSADTFEAVVELIRLGGQRNHLTTTPAWTRPTPNPSTPLGTSGTQPDWLKPKVFTGSGSQI